MPNYKHDTYREGLYQPYRLLDSGLYIPNSVEEYEEFWRHCIDLGERKKHSLWTETLREYGRADLFFFINYVLTEGKKLHSDTRKPLYMHKRYLDYCRNNQWLVDNYLSSVDSSSRSFAKSHIRTKSLMLQFLMNHINASCVIFSVKRESAAKHADEIRAEIESNKLLYILYPEIVWPDPRDSAKIGETRWSLESGFVLKRTRPRMNASIEHQRFGAGAVGSRYDVGFYDDCESEDVVNSKENLVKLQEDYAATIPLLTPVEIPQSFIVMNNTQYSAHGLVARKFQEYKNIDARRAICIMSEKGTHVNNRFTPDPCPEEEAGPAGGEPQYPFTKATLWEYYNEGGRSKYYTQYLGDMSQGGDLTFKRANIAFVAEHPHKMARGCNAYVNIDCSHGLHDPTGAWVWGIGPDGRKRWIGGFRKKMDPASPAFAAEIYNLVSKYDSLCIRVVEIRVEQLPNQTWADLVRSELQKNGCYIPVVACKNKVPASRTGQFKHAKQERIWSRWSHALQAGEIIFPTPKSMGGHGIVAHDEKNNVFCLVDYFLNFEYDMFPQPKFDDLFDAGGLIWEPDANKPIVPPFTSRRNERRFQGRQPATSWMSA